MITHIRNWKHFLTLCAALFVAVLVFPAYTCQLEKSDPAEVVTPLNVDDGIPFQLLVEAIDNCSGNPISNGPTNENLVGVSAIPVATTDQTPLPGAPTVEYSGVQGIMSLTPITAATVLYNWQIGADGYVAQTIMSMAVSRRLYRVTLDRVGGCPPPEVCDVCDPCPVCPTFPDGVSLDACLAAPSNGISPTTPLYYCCNVPQIDNTDPSCSPFVVP